jgi:hypothetical protein
MRNIRILAAAAEEAAEAIDWYEGERAGLGLEFQTALDNALDLLEAELVPLVNVSRKFGRHDLKRLLLNRFPYAIVLLVRPTEYVVVAFAHFSRRPGYWRKRIRSQPTI